MHRSVGWLVGFFLSPLGLVVLAALDSTIFFALPFGLDAGVIVVTARFRGLTIVIPLLVTAGSLVGAGLTFWMGVRIGEAELHRYIQPRRLESIHRHVQTKGAIALAALDLIPPPFPFTPFLLAAGALEVNARRFFLTLTGCRLLRFGGEAFAAWLYGRQILGWFDTELFRDAAGVVIVLAVIASVISIVRLVQITGDSKRARAA